MKNISEIDENFKVNCKLNRRDIKFYDPLKAPFAIHGLILENGMLRRLPKKVAQSVSKGVYGLHANTSGGRLRFKTDSTYVALSVLMDDPGRMPHFAFSGSMGFDLYADNDYVKTFVPPLELENHYESIIEFGDRKLRDITINFPLYSDVNELYIGIEENAHLDEPSSYKNIKPFVYYGSSITQGGCASRPGTCYQSIVSRRFHCDYINLGFSGNAKAEDEMIDYIKNLDMSLFICDYDHNAPNPEHLRNTHERMFNAVREAKPDLPIILMIRPKFKLTEEEEERRHVVEETYNNAVAVGDKNVYFIDNRQLTALCGNEGTVDGVHPNDFGFASMAKALGDVIEKIKLL